jgi:hypothetical protein
MQDDTDTKRQQSSRSAVAGEVADCPGNGDKVLEETVNRDVIGLEEPIIRTYHHCHAEERLSDSIRQIVPGRAESDEDVNSGEKRQDDHTINQRDQMADDENLARAICLAIGFTPGCLLHVGSASRRSARVALE